MRVNLKAKTWAVFGYKGSGKSTLAQYVARQYGPSCLYYDTLHEAPASAPYQVYQPVDRQSPNELIMIVGLLQAGKARGSLDVDCFIIDEANRYCKPKPAPLPQGVADLNDWCRHYNLSVGYVARRPVQLNSDVTEICDYLFVFQLGGKNDISYLNDLKVGLGNLVAGLGKHEFVLVGPDRSYSKQRPLDLTKSKA